MNKKSRHPSVQEVAAQTARITVISNWFDDPRTSDNMGHFRTFQANPHNWKSADPLCGSRREMSRFLPNHLPVLVKEHQRSRRCNVSLAPVRCLKTSLPQYGLEPAFIGDNDRAGHHYCFPSHQGMILYQ